jgi:hypothetical protein
MFAKHSCPIRNNIIVSVCLITMRFNVLGIGEEGEFGKRQLGLCTKAQ